LKVERRPLMLNEASREAPIDDCRAPGDSNVSAEYSRPFSGSARVCSAVMIWLRSLESVCSNTALALTSMVSVSWPTTMLRSTRCRAPTVTCTLSTSATEKPAFSAVIT